MNYVYECEKCFMFNEDIGHYTSYGIALKGTDIGVKDISTNKKEVEYLVKLLNKNQADPIHLKDIVQDFIVKQQMVRLVSVREDLHNLKVKLELQDNELMQGNSLTSKLFLHSISYLDSAISKLQKVIK